MTADARLWIDAPRTETLIPLQHDRWKRRLLKKSANSDVAHWLEHNRITQRCVWKGEVTNILMRLTTQEELERSDHSFFTKVIRAKRTTVRDGRTNDGSNDPAEHNEEYPD